MPIRNVNNLSLAGMPAALTPVTEKPVTQERHVEPLPAQKQKEAVLPDVLEQAIQEANEMLKHVRPDIKFVIDADTHEVVMMMVEPETDNVLKRYPSEQALVISHAITGSKDSVTVGQHGGLRNSGDGLLGLLVEQKI